jgi:hypothetical protein
LHAPALATFFAHIGAGFGAGGIFGGGGILGGAGHFGHITFFVFALQVHITSVPPAQADMHIELAAHTSPVLQTAKVGPASGGGAGALVSAASVPLAPPLAA